MGSASQVLLFLAAAALYAVTGVTACYDSANACGQGNCVVVPNSGNSCTYSMCHCAEMGGSCPTETLSDDSVCAVCNMMGCDCTTCEPGCTAYCGPDADPNRHRRSLLSLDGGARALLGASSSLASSIASNVSCGHLKAWAKLPLGNIHRKASSSWCAEADQSVGFKFLGHLLGLLDCNGDGEITCTEWKEFHKLSVKSVITQIKPNCPLRQYIKDLVKSG